MTPSVADQGISVILRQDDRGVRPDCECSGHRHSVSRFSVGGKLASGRVGESGVVAGPVTVKPHLPGAFAREAKGVVGVATVCAVEQHDRVVSRPALVPPVIGEHLVHVVDVVNVPGRCPATHACCRIDRGAGR